MSVPPPAADEKPPVALTPLSVRPCPKCWYNEPYLMRTCAAHTLPERRFLGDGKDPEVLIRAIRQPMFSNKPKV